MISDSYATVSEIANIVGIKQPRITVFLQNHASSLDPSWIEQGKRWKRYKIPETVEYILANTDHTKRPHKTNAKVQAKKQDRKQPKQEQMNRQPPGEQQAESDGQRKQLPATYYHAQLLRQRAILTKIEADMAKGKIVDREKYEKMLYDQLRMLRDSLYSMIEFLAETFNPALSKDEFYAKLKAELEKNLVDIVSKAGEIKTRWNLK
jgi:hypothetical protein